MRRVEPTKEFIRARYDYISNTGWLVFKAPVSKGQVVGERAGTNTVLTHRNREDKYRRVSIKGAQFSEHRIIWIYFNGSIPEDKQIDHINGDGRDNRIENLRLATSSQNMVNVLARKNGSVFGRNVYLLPSKRYRVYISLGTYKTAEEAIQVAYEANKKLYGDFVTPEMYGLEKTRHPMERTMTTNGKMASSPRFDELVRAFIKLRDILDKMDERHKQEKKKPLRLKELLTEELLEGLASTGQEMARTKFGTVSAAVRVTPSCSDPNLFIAYVRENDAYELMDRRPNGTACAEFAKEHGQLPPGVKVNSIRYVNVRAATQTEDL